MNKVINTCFYQFMYLSWFADCKLLKWTFMYETVGSCTPSSFPHISHVHRIISPQVLLTLDLVDRAKWSTNRSITSWHKDCSSKLHQLDPFTFMQYFIMETLYCGEFLMSLVFKVLSKHLVYKVRIYQIYRLHLQKSWFLELVWYLCFYVEDLNLIQ